MGDGLFTGKSYTVRPLYYEVSTAHLAWEQESSE